MNFGPHHYVPVLKIKRGEKLALQLVAPALKAQVVPLLEIVERRPDKAPTVEAHLKTAFADLPESVEGYSRCFLDARELAQDGPSAAAAVFRRATTLGIPFAPITSIGRVVDTAAALKHRSHGLGLRLTRSEFEKGGLTANLQSFMTGHGLSPEETDLIVDLGPVDSLIAEGIRALTMAILNEVPDHKKWRTFTVSGCAFPFSMKGIKANSDNTAERSEWIAWRDGLYGNRHELSRVPTFSDCAIQHPAGVEGFDPRYMPISASVRYTLSEDWLLMKGKSNRITPLREQYPALARQLVRGQLKKHFAGDDHCGGCASMLAASKGAPRLGSPEVWRRLGTIHHVTTVVKALAALPAS